jgi:hypothetical protein
MARVQLAAPDEPITLRDGFASLSATIVGDDMVTEAFGFLAN